MGNFRQDGIGILNKISTMMMAGDYSQELKQISYRSRSVNVGARRDVLTLRNLAPGFSPSRLSFSEHPIAHEFDLNATGRLATVLPY